MEDDDPRSEGYKLAMNSPLDEPLKIYPVSDLVNSPKKDDAWGAKNGAERVGGAENRVWGCETVCKSERRQR